MSLAEIGERLRTRRAELGLTLRDAQMATKIQERYLAALEAGDDSILPGEVYAKGYIRSYANFLGLDGQVLAKEYESAIKGGIKSNNASNTASWRKSRRRENRWLPRTQPAQARVVKRAKPNRSRSAVQEQRLKAGSIILLLVLAVVAAVGVYILWVTAQTEFPGAMGQNGDQEQTASGDSDETRAAGTGPGPGEDDQDDTPESGDEPAPTLVLESREGSTSVFKVGPGPIKVDVSVTDRCWVRVEADGETIMETILEPGTTLAWEAGDELTVRAGFPGGLDMAVYGQPVDKPDQPGTPHTFVFRRES